ncbi:MAG: hydrogenase maturation protease [Chloroflexi bacterium]|nr:hydrogenase maturation protease [Chloroflexota bacterium]
MKKLVLGIGNPILGDDGVGFRVIEALQPLIPQGEITLTSSDVSGLALLDYVVDFDEVIIVDAIQTVNGKPGDIYVLNVGDLRTSKHTISPHDVDLQTALELGKILKLKLPGKINIVAIEIPEVSEFSEELSAPVEESVPIAARMVLDMLKTGNEGGER